MNVISLLELQTTIKGSIDALADSYWVAAEISQLTLSGGHCYLELVQHSGSSERLEAKAAAVVWKQTYRLLAASFADAAGMPLSAGMKALLRVSVQYHAIHGLQLNVIDIDPAYTIGEAEMQRSRTLARLRAEGVINMNRTLPLPPLPQRIAVISSEQAAGYRDFTQQLANNPQGYRFAVTLFSATVQGQNAEQSIADALYSICERQEKYDIVAILRGGGSQSDLLCFDSYRVAYLVAQFPLPVITGIGHDKDISVTDCTAHTMLKTPTAAAEFCIEMFAVQERRLEALRSAALSLYNKQMEQYRTRLHQYAPLIEAGISGVWSTQYERIAVSFPHRLHTAAVQYLQQENSRCRQLHRQLHLLDPQNILRRGYSITLLRGRMLRTAQQANAGEQVQIILSEGKLTAAITDTAA